MVTNRDHFFLGDSIFRRIMLHNAVGEKHYRAIMKRSNQMLKSIKISVIDKILNDLDDEYGKKYEDMMNFGKSIPYAHGYLEGKIDLIEEIRLKIKEMVEGKINE